MDTTAIIHSSTPDLTTRPSASYGQLVDFWNNNQTKVADLERSAETREGILSKALENNRLHDAYVDNFIQTLANYVKEGDVDIEIADDLAECFGRELTRKVVGHIRIEGDVELEVPAYFDLDAIGEELDIHIGQAYTSTVRVDYSDISLVEIEEF